MQELAILLQVPHFALGFGGNCITFSTIAGEIITDIILQ